MTDAEKRAYCNYFNGELRGDADLKETLPINSNSDDFYKAVSQCLLLSKFITKRFPGQSVEPTASSVIAAAKQVGVKVNIAPDELEDSVNNIDMVLEFVWQLIKAYLSKIEPNEDLKRLLEGDEKLAVLCSQPEKLLIRWFNFHLKVHGHHRTVSNFTSDLKDAENYAVLLSEIAKDSVSEDDLVEAFKQKNPAQRAEMVLRWAARIGCRKFVTPKDIAEGNANLNFAFVATLFKRYPALGPTSDEIVSDLELRIEETESLLAESILDKEDLRSQIDQTLLDFDSLTAELADLELNFDEICSERDSLQSEKTDLESLLAEVNAENLSLEEEIDSVSSEKDDFFAQLEAEINIKVDLETLLKETKEEFETTKTTTETKISDLQKQLEEEIALKDDYSKRLEDSLLELENTKLEAKELESSLEAKLEAHITERKEVSSQLDAARAELEETLRLADEAEQTKDDLFKLLTDTITELETAKANAQATQEELENTLAEEKAKKEKAHQALLDKIEEFETALAAWKVEREGLLQRIEELENELEELREEMAAKLAQALADKAAALAAALSERERALNAAENEKDQALGKVRMLLSGTAKEGPLWKLESTLVGLQWKKKYFVLQDNLFCWYSSEKNVSGQKPKGVIYCEESRIYEMDGKDLHGKKEFVFQIDTGKTRVNIAAETQEDLKSWMTEIRVAKKKKLGVKVVSEAGDKNEKGKKKK
mmetsp:Transcript_26083/g.40067  ORF Transcript_26083/g.40067 Transcript_26083/m.40067 type:complete len:715 (+) Transcript_26083:28-2172(+)